MTDADLKLNLCGRVLDRQPYPMAFVTISGAHLYGFASPDSDYDIRGMHVLPVREMITLDQSRETIEFSGIEEGVEIDLVTHDALKFCRMLLKRNGYVLEQLTSPLVVRTSAIHAELCALVPQLVTRHHVYHYLGFTHTQRGLLMKENPPRIKPLLYAYRVLLTGIHLMRTGRVEANLVNLHVEHGGELRTPYIPDLISSKVHGRERDVLSSADLEFHDREHDRLEAELHLAGERTSLPEEPTARAALNDLLLRLRNVT
jgi:uncharacterized protein